MKKYVIYISFNNRLTECILPGVDNRKGCMDLSGETGVADLRLSYEVWDGIWHLLTNDSVRLSRDHMVQEDVVLREGDVLHGKVMDSDIRFTIMVYLLDGQSAVYEKYDIRSLDQIRIGGNNGCDIVLKDDYVSSIHTMLYRTDHKWYIQDNSKNGTYVNGRKLTGPQMLHAMDTIYILGFKLVYLGNILAVNQRQRRFVRLDIAPREKLQNTCDYEDASIFSRVPRQMEPLDKEEIEIEAPPAAGKLKKTPLIFILGPSLTMPVPILTMVLFNVAVNAGSGVNPLSYMGMAISVIMFALLGVFWTIMRNRYDKKAAAENEIHRQNAYQSYLRQNEQLLVEKQVKNRSILEHMYRQSELLATELLSSRSLLWNRNINHEDFLQIRAGTGCMDAPNQIRVPRKRFSVDADPLAALPGQLYEKYKYLSQSVKLLDLKEHKLIGVVGGLRDINEIANSMIIQIAALHSYIDVKMVFLTDRQEGKTDLRWARWLPHTFSGDKKIRFFADDGQSIQNVLFAITSVIRSRSENQNDTGREKDFSQHYIVFTTSKSVYESEAIYKYMTDGGDYGFTFIMLHGEMDGLPNECKCLIECTSNFQGVYMLDRARSFADQARFDRVNTFLSDRFARGISGVSIRELAEGTIPESIDYMSMLGIGRIEQWDLLKHYKENRSFEGIRALVGVMAGNKPMILDIHEKKYGPHGLIAGTTGSGKSETIQTFILSLALNYHPDEVAFILIDYKGGGMSDIFSGLPHLAGMITNLGEGGEEQEAAGSSQTRRALISIRSEIKRRQAVFRKYKVNHIDMYMRIYRDKKAEEPMPHLVMISDEFAELKKEQPEFIRELVSTARVGRSLGIHLILATQKPAGVVDDEIWSNARFKICLRVQDRQDSVGMLKRPEAASLTTTGRAYLQIGNDELFEMFQSGYSGASYEPKEDVKGASDDDASMIGIDGGEAVLRPKKQYIEGEAEPQLKVCLDYIIQKADQYQIHPAAPLWMPRLAARIILQDIDKKYDVDYSDRIIAVLGEVDDPEQQSQYPLTLDLDHTVNLLIVGNTGCGKTTMLKTMIMSLTSHYKPEEIQFYCLDFSSQTLRVFEKLPHCGGVVFAQEEEKVMRLLRLLKGIAKERKAALEKASLGDYREYLEGGKALPLILFMIDNYFGFAERYADLAEELVKMTRDYAKYGIIMVVTANRPSDLPYKLRQNFARILPIQLQDKGEYLEIFGHSPEILPENIAGRGLVPAEDILEYQGCLPAPGGQEKERSTYIRNAVSSWAAGYQGMYAVPVPILNTAETYDLFWERYKDNVQQKGYLPAGYDKDSLETVGIDLKSDYCICISAGKDQGIENCFCNLLYAAGKTGYHTDYIVSENINQDACAGLAAECAGGYESVRNLLIELKKDFKSRDAKWHGWQDKRLVFIRNMRSFMELIYDGKNPEAMYPLVEVFFKDGAKRGIFFIAGFEADAQSSYLYMQACRNYTAHKKIWHLGGALNQQKVAEFPVPYKEQSVIAPYNEGYGLDRDKVQKLYVPVYKGNM